jgi:lipopolysaccharide export LptBFGC system permease protein LptF
MPPSELPSDNPAPQPSRHTRRPPLAEIDSWELWQEWKRGEHAEAMPWMRLLAGFCVVLAAMYSFFYVSSTLSDDTIAPIALLVVYVGFLYWIWARISPRKSFALGIVAVMVAVSLVAFALWFVAYWLSGWSVWVGIVGTLVLGLLGLAIALPGLNAMAERSGDRP